MCEEIYLDANNVPFVDKCGGYTCVFNLWKFLE